MKRLFVALEISEECRETLAELARPLSGVHWLPPEQFHLTLAFLGNVAEDAEVRLRQRLGEIRVPPFFLPLEGLGTFGGSRPSVLWAGVGSGHPHLFALHKRVHDALFAAGLDPELRPFHPHITLARVKGVSPATLRPLLREHESTEFCLLRIADFALFSSVLGPGGSRHTVEMRRSLATDD